VKLLVKAGKKLKKNNVAVDIVNFGEEEHNTEILQEFLKAVKSTDNSHLITVPSGTQQLLSDILISSPIFAQQGGLNDLGLPDGTTSAGIPGGDDGAGVGGTGAAGNAFGGIDPNMDPEMAMAIRQSLEEERARQEALTREEQNAGANAPSANANVVSENAENQSIDANPAVVEPVGNDEPENQPMADDDEELLQALQMSMQEGKEAHDVESSAAVTSPQATDALDDDAYMKELLSGLPGVDANELDVKDLLGDQDKEKTEDEDGDTQMEDKDKKTSKNNEKDQNQDKNDENEM